MKKCIGILILLTLSTSLLADTIEEKWHCFAFDSWNRSYEATGKTLQSAMNHANAACKKSSKQRRCRVAQSFCEQSLMGNRCLVSDNNGRSWNAPGPNACQKAMSSCMEWQFLHGNPNQCSIKHR